MQTQTNSGTDGRSLAELVQEGDMAAFEARFKEDPAVQVARAKGQHGELAYIPLELISFDPSNERPEPTLDNDPDLAGLVESIQASGVLQPVRVYRRGEGHSGNYILSSGHRRVAAARIAGLSEVPAFIATPPAPAMKTQEHIDRLATNLQRRDLAPLALARSIRAVLDADGNATQEWLADKLGMSQSRLANILRVLALPKPVLDFLDEGRLTMGHAIALTGIKHPEYTWDGKKINSVPAVIQNIAASAVRDGYSVHNVENRVGSHNRYAESRLVQLADQERAEAARKAQIEARQQADRERLETARSAQYNKVREAAIVRGEEPPDRGAWEATAPELAAVVVSREDLEAQKRREAHAAGRRRTANVRAAYAAILEAAAIPPSGPTLAHLRLAAHTLNNNTPYSQTESTKMWGLPAREVMAGMIDAAPDEAAVLDLLARIALGGLSVEWSGDRVDPYPICVFADKAWGLNKVIALAIKNVEL